MLTTLVLLLLWHLLLPINVELPWINVQPDHRITSILNQCASWPPTITSPPLNIPTRFCLIPSIFHQTLLLLPATAYSVEHNAGSANCFITNNKEHFVNFTSHPIKVQQLDGSIASALGFCLKLIQHQPSNYIIPLWPTYFMPQNPSCTFSLTALKYYLQYPSVTTTHLKALSITTPCAQLLEFPSLIAQVASKALDYHLFTIVKPITRLSYIPHPIGVKAAAPPLTRALIHQ
jgi:hypothetical protein